MNLFMNICIRLILILPIFLLISCGDSGSQLSKGHRDAIKIQCEDTSDPKACGLEVRQKFLEDGNEFTILDDGELSKDEIKKIKFECIRQKKYGLETYNNCLGEYKIAALDNELFDKKLEEKPKSNIEDLEESVVYIEIVIWNEKEKKEFGLAAGSGVIISKKEIATNCHVAMAGASEEAIDELVKLKWDPDNLRKVIWVKTINGEDWAEAKLIKKNVNKDVCIIQHQPKGIFQISMKPAKKFISFDKLKKGNFVRAMGSPGGMIGHTSTGDIQWLGTGEQLNRNFDGKLTDSKGLAFDKDTKFIVHSARVHQGSSGGPLFDKNGAIIGLNTLISYTAAENIAVSADHIKDLLYNK